MVHGIHQGSQEKGDDDCVIPFLYAVRVKRVWVRDRRFIRCKWAVHSFQVSFKNGIGMAENADPFDHILGGTDDFCDVFHLFFLNPSGA